MIAGFLFFLLEKITSMLVYREWYVARTNQIAASGYLFRTKQRRFCCALWYALACIACLYMFI